MLAILSLLINLLVLVPVCAGLMTNAHWTQSCYGPPSPARGILLSVYLSIAAASGWLLVEPDPRQIAVLLSLQILYKLTTPLTVRTLRNPVVLSNLVIAGFHALTLFVIMRSGGNSLVGL